MYICMYVCTYICLYVFTLGSTGMQLNSYEATGAKWLTEEQRLAVSDTE